MIRKQLGKQELGTEQGELVSYRVNGHEFIHQKGSPGWGSSDTEMFPIIGPTAESNFRVSTPKGEAVLDQHGLFRELDYVLLEEAEHFLRYKKEYQAGTRVKNSKYPAKSTEPWLSWPYDFEIRKEFRLQEEGLRIRFILSGEEGMPFMFGYHPAFKIHTEGAVVRAGDREIGMQEVLDAGSRALQVANCESVRLQDSRELQIQTSGFGHFMLWTEVPNMLCIEPISFYPYAVEQAALQKGFQTLGPDPVQFEIAIHHD